MPPVVLVVEATASSPQVPAWSIDTKSCEMTLLTNPPHVFSLACDSTVLLTSANDALHVANASPANAFVFASTWNDKHAAAESNAQDPLMSASIKTAFLRVLDTVCDWIFTKPPTPVFVDVLVDVCGRLEREFPKTVDGTSPKNMQRAASRSQVTTIANILLKRRSPVKGRRAMSVLILSRHTFDATAGPIPTDCLRETFFFILVPCTFAAVGSPSLAASASYVHSTLINLLALNDMDSGLVGIAGARLARRGGIGKILAESDYEVACFIFVEGGADSTSTNEQADEGNPSCESFHCFLPLLEAVALRKAPKVSTAMLEAELASTRQRVSKLETLLKLQRGGDAAHIEAELSLKLHDALLELDLVREERAMLREQLDAKVIGIHEPTRELCPHTVGDSEPGTCLMRVRDSSAQTEPIVGAQQHAAVDFALPSGQVPLVPADDSSSDGSNDDQGIVSMSSAGSSLSSMVTSSGSSDDSDSDVATLENWMETIPLGYSNWSKHLYSHDVEKTLEAPARQTLKKGDNVNVLLWPQNGTQQKRCNRVLRTIKKHCDAASQAVMHVGDVAACLDAMFRVSLSEASGRLQCLAAHVNPLQVNVTDSEPQFDAAELATDVASPFRNSSLVVANWLNPLNPLCVPCVRRLVMTRTRRGCKSGAPFVGVAVTALAVVQTPDTQSSVIAIRVSWYRTHATLGTHVHVPLLIRREMKTVTSMREVELVYTVAAADVGAQLWCEVVPRTFPDGRWGAAASVSTPMVQQCRRPALEVAHARLVMHSDHKGNTTFVSPLVASGTLLSVDYELVSWTLEGKTRLRWFCSSTHVMDQHLIGSFLSPWRTFCIPLQALFRTLYVEITPIDRATKQPGSTLRTLGLLVLPHAAVVQAVDSVVLAKYKSAAEAQKGDGCSAEIESWALNADSCSFATFYLSKASEEALGAAGAQPSLSVSEGSCVSHEIVEQLFKAFCISTEKKVDALSPVLQSEATEWDDEHIDLLHPIRNWIHLASNAPCVNEFRSSRQFTLAVTPSHLQLFSTRLLRNTSDPSALLVQWSWAEIQRIVEVPFPSCGPTLGADVTNVPRQLTHLLLIGKDAKPIAAIIADVSWASYFYLICTVLRNMRMLHANSEAGNVDRETSCSTVQQQLFSAVMSGDVSFAKEFAAKHGADWRRRLLPRLSEGISTGEKFTTSLFTSLLLASETSVVRHFA